MIMTRTKFDQQLDELNLQMIRMGSLCERSINQAVKALLEGDQELAKSTIALDSEIDQKEREIEAFCLKLLLQQHPVASDLRHISAVLKMITDLERIGDQAADIAEITTYLNGRATGRLKHIREMAEATSRMVTESIDAFVRRDLQLVREVIDYDDVVDGLFDKVKGALIRLIHEDVDNGEFAIDLLMIAKYFERIGDHATNIAEWAQFSIEGRHPDYQEKKE